MLSLYVRTKVHITYYLKKYLLPAETEASAATEGSRRTVADSLRCFKKNVYALIKLPSQTCTYAPNNNFI